MYHLFMCLILLSCLQLYCSPHIMNGSENYQNQRFHD